jgi:hypothetical protein
LALTARILTTKIEKKALKKLYLILVNTKKIPKLHRQGLHLKPVELKNTFFYIFLALFGFSAGAQTATPTPEAEPAASGWVNPEHTSEDYMGGTDGWFIGADVGRTVFYGDVALYNTFPKRSQYKQSLGNGGSFYFGKKFTFGLSAEVQGFMGTLKGKKISGKLYHRTFDADYFQYSVNAKYNLSQLAFRDIPGRKFFNRFTVYITAGGGQMFFRSRLYKLAVNNTWYLDTASGYNTVGIDSISATVGGGDVTQKTKMLSAIAIPAGAKINFKLNGTTDLVLDLTYTTIFSDYVDSWVRNWSHKDRYLYMGVGLVYNLNTGKDADIPEDQRIFRPKSKTKDAYDKDAGGGSSEKKGGLFNFGGRPRSGNKKEDRDLEIRMKMYELQLKLFEMQYLMGQ